MGKKDKCCHSFEKKGKCCKGCPLKDEVESEKKGKKKNKDQKDKDKKDVTIQHKLFSSNPIKFLTGFSLNFFRIQPVSDSAQSTALFAPSELFWQHRNTGAYPRV
ncbi:MAG: hypothetical protein ACWGKN_13670 [Desulfoprunum sp.]